MGLNGTSQGAESGEDLRHRTYLNGPSHFIATGDLLHSGPLIPECHRKHSTPPVQAAFETSAPMFKGS